MHVTPLAIPDVLLITPRIFRDPRGFFSETFSARAWTAAGLRDTFVQDNHAYSQPVGTVRGLHYQIPPFAQGKLVRVTRGAILDVAVDIRRGSATFGRHVSARLSTEDWNQLWVPAGFAHGYATLEADTEVIYKVTDFYAPEADRGIAWDDPDLAIDWGLAPGSAILSDKDTRHPRLKDAMDLF